MYENAHIQTVALDFSRRRIQEPCISRMECVELQNGKIKRSVSQLNSVSLA